MEIPSKIIDSLIEWNSVEEIRGDAEYDKRFVTILLLALIDDEHLAKNQIPNGIMDFITGMRILYLKVVI